MEKIEDYLKDKKVLIVGPSENVIKDYDGMSEDNYDIVCKINNHWMNPLDKIRTDVVYHCLNIDITSEDSLVYMRDNNIKLVTRNEIRETTSTTKILRFIEINKKVGLEYYEIPKTFFEKCTDDLGCNPNTGVLAILHILSMSIESLTVIGFDFYETLHLGNSNPKTLRKIQQGKVSNHQPKPQLEFIKEVYESDDRLIITGRLKELMKK